MCWIAEAFLSPLAANVVRYSKTINPRSRIRSLVESNFLAGRRSFSREEKSPWSISSSVRVAIVVDVTRKKVTITDLVFRMTILASLTRRKKAMLVNTRLSGFQNVMCLFIWYVCISYFVKNRIVLVSIKYYVSTHVSTIITDPFIIPMYLSVKYWHYIADI